MIDDTEEQFQNAVRYLYDLEVFGINLGLDRMKALLNAFGNPHQNMKFIHIAGTNGKGSVAAMLDSVLREHGYNTGLYTSPHLVDVRERIRFNGDFISKQDFITFVRKLEPAIKQYQCTFFEAMTALALLYFSSKNIDYAILEVGLGGRLDATNVVTPVCSVITSVQFDHTSHLGKTLKDIAVEKAGIIKENIPSVVGDLPLEAKSEIVKIAQSRKSMITDASVKYRLTHVDVSKDKSFFQVETPLWGDKPFEIPFIGEFQVKNTLIVLAALFQLTDHNLALSYNHINNGLRKAVWQGRFQKIQENPTVIADVAHNPASMQQLVKNFEKLYQDSKIVILLGLLDDKDYKQIIEILKPVAKIIVPLEFEAKRALNPSVLQREICKSGIESGPVSTVAEGLDYALKHYKNYIICATGSHFVIGEVFKKIKA